MIFVREGHNEPMLYRAATDSWEDLTAPGMALGFVRDYDFEVAGPVLLSEGDILVLYTDGVPEARNGSGEQYETDRFREVVRSRRTRPAEEIVDCVVREVEQFQASKDFDDDLTIIVVKVTGEGPPPIPRR